MPSLNAPAIIPRCRISARSTWSYLQRVRRLLSLLVPNLPDLIWSIWHSSKARGLPQRTHLPPSLSQTLRRVSSHISCGCRFLGILYQTSPLQTRPELALLGLSLPLFATLDHVKNNGLFTPPDYAALRHTFLHSTNPRRTPLRRVKNDNDSLLCRSNLYQSPPFNSLPHRTLPHRTIPHRTLLCRVKDNGSLPRQTLPNLTPLHRTSFHFTSLFHSPLDRTRPRYSAISNSVTSNLPMPIARAFPMPTSLPASIREASI